MPAEILKFDQFELDLGRYELRRGSRVLKLEKIPMELLILLAQGEGRLVTREQIVERLWGNDVFVDTRQGINTAVRKIRLALKDDPDNPRILQTVIGKGYRLSAPVAVESGDVPEPSAVRMRHSGGLAASVKLAPIVMGPVAAQTEPESPETNLGSGALESRSATPAPSAQLMSPRSARMFFMVAQAGYLMLYGAAFVHFDAISRLGLPAIVPLIALWTGLAGSAVRIYLLAAVALNHSGSGRLFRQMFPGILLLDGVWAASPLLLYPQIGELSLLGVAALAFLPFSQRTLMACAYPVSPGR